MKTVCTATVALFFLTGCAVPHPAIGDGVHVVQPKDIPVPDGFNLNQYGHQSNTLEVGDYRYVNLVYEGDQPVIQVANYLLQRMPQHSHRLISQENKGDGHEFLVFRRGRYTTECTVRRLEYSTRLEIRVRTKIQP